MRALLDTHAFLWWITNDQRLSPGARAVMVDGENRLFLSAASGWEIAIKAGLGKLQISDEPSRFVPRHMSVNGIDPLPVLLAHALHVYYLPGYHQDPFDRLLVAQSELDKLPIVTADPQVKQYDVDVVW